MRFPSRLAVVAREGARPGLRREPAAAGRVLPRDDASLRLAGRRLQLQGDQPTFNDLLDLDAAYRIATDFTAPTCCIVKQGNPVGLASNDRLRRGYQRALEGDPVSAFGAVVAFNRVVDAETAEEIAGNAYEARRRTRASPPRRAQILAEKAASRRCSRCAAQPFEGLPDYGIARPRLPRIDGGLLVETRDRSELDRSQLKVVTRRRPTLEELTDLLFAWRAVRHVTSQRGRAGAQRRARRRGRRAGHRA